MYVRRKRSRQWPSAKLRRDKIKQRIYIDILVIGIYSMRGLFGDRSSSRSMASSALRLGVPVSSGVEAGACTRGSGVATAADVAAEVPPLSDGACAEESRDAPAADVAAEAPPLSDGVRAGASAGAPAVDVVVEAPPLPEVDSSIFSGGAVAPLLAFVTSSTRGAISAGGAVPPLFAVPALSTGGAMFDWGAMAPLFAVPAFLRGGTTFDLSAMAALFPVKRTSVTDKAGSGSVSVS